MTREESEMIRIAEARPEITEAMVFSHVKGEDEYFSEEEFPQVPLILAKLVGDGELTMPEALGFALKQAESLKKDEVFLVCLTAFKQAGINFYENINGGWKPYAILTAVAPRMLALVLEERTEDSTFAKYKKLCGLAW